MTSLHINLQNGEPLRRYNYPMQLPIWFLYIFQIVKQKTDCNALHSLRCIIKSNDKEKAATTRYKIPLFAMRRDVKTFKNPNVS